MIVAEVLRQTACRLLPCAGEAARLEAELLLAEVRGQSRARLLAELRQPVSPQQLAALEDLVRRRLEGEPVAYLLGRREFMSLEFRVGPEVLVPRPETEVLVEKALEILRQGRWRRPVVVDVGTGCGNIALSLAYYFPRARVMGTDLSPAALRLARINARRLGLSHRVGFYRGDLLRPLLARRVPLCPGLPGAVSGAPRSCCCLLRNVGSKAARFGSLPTRRRFTGPAVRCSRRLGPHLRVRSGSWEGSVAARVCAGRSRCGRRVRADLVVANLPYISTARLEKLPPEVRREPRLALDGGQDGLALYRRLLKQVGGVLRPGGYLALEMSPEQEETLGELLVGAGFRGLTVLPDGAGRPRGWWGRFFPG